MERESALGNFLILGKSSSQWEEQEYKRGVGTAHSVSLQDAASPADDASAHLSEPLLCTDHR